MNSKRYQEQVLEGHLKDFYASMVHERGSITFQQDGASSHTSKTTKQWFTSHKIPLLFHPSSSPDLNPIEHVWHELKARIRGLPHPPSTIEALRDAAYQAWDELPIEIVNKHIESMPKRAEAVCAARGGHTRF